MNVTASKILLGLSLTAYTWCSWDHLTTGHTTETPVTKTKELTAAMVSHPVKLAIARDPFNSAPLPGGAPGATGLAASDPASPSMGGAVRSAENAEQIAANFKLQGTLLLPPQRGAIINGKVCYQGEPSSVGPGPSITVKRVGLDYAIIDSATGPITLKLETPKQGSSSPDRPATAGAPKPGGGGLGGPAYRSMASSGGESR